MGLNTKAALSQRVASADVGMKLLALAAFEPMSLCNESERERADELRLSGPFQKFRSFDFNGWKSYPRQTNRFSHGVI